MATRFRARCLVRYAVGCMDLDTLKEIVEDLNVEEDRDRIPLLKEEEYEKSEKLVVADVDEPQELLVTPEQTGDAESEGDDQSEETPEPPQLTDQFDNPLHFRIVEELPEFPGGASEFVRFLTTHLRYPAVAKSITYDASMETGNRQRESLSYDGLCTNRL